VFKCFIWVLGLTLILGIFIIIDNLIHFGFSQEFFNKTWLPIALIFLGGVAAVAMMIMKGKSIPWVGKKDEGKEEK